MSDRLNELPASSDKVGKAIADIFSGPGEDAGLEYIKTLGKIKPTLMRSRNRLENLVNWKRNN